MLNTNDSFLTSLLKTLQSYPCKSYILAYSGGMDSHVLLHALALLKAQNKLLNIRAIHIDHGLQSESSSWSQHCQNTAKSLGIPCEIIKLNLQVPSGESIEAVARDARYQAFNNVLQQDEILLTAHHQDDQAETVLLQLFRGAGVDGLAAMPESKPFAEGVLLRPLLNYSRKSLEEYATDNQLDYIDDPSNFDTDFDRNFLRHDVIPMLEQRWQGVKKNLNRVARLQAEAQTRLEEITKQDLLKVISDEENAENLSVAKLLKLSKLQQKAVIRLWLKQLNFRMPSEVKLKHILNDVLLAKADANPRVHWEDVEIRRFQGKLYAVKILKDFDANRIIPWDARHSLYIESTGHTLEPKRLGKWMKRLQQSDKVTVRFRQGGEQIRLQGHQQTAALKKLMQAANIPPWERNTLPLIYLDNKLVIAYPYWSSEQ